MTEPTETARHLLYRYQLPEDVIDGALCLHARELAAVQRAAIAKTDDPVFYEGEAGWLINLIEPGADEEPAAVPVVVPPADQTALRDRIAEALALRVNGAASDGRGWFRSREQREALLADADAVLAVLPAADRAATYREVADRLAVDAERGGKDGLTRIYRRSAARQVRTWADELGGETQQAEPQGHVCKCPAELCGCGHHHSAARQDPTPDSERPADGRCAACGHTVCDGDGPCGARSGNDFCTCPGAAAVESAAGTPQPKEADNPRAVCVCGHTRGEHLAVSGRLLCDACDPGSTDNLVCRGFDAL